MNSDTMTQLTADALLEHDRWLRGLIRQLIGDGPAAAGQADDVLQEVWGAAVRRPPDLPGAERSWLRTVAKRVVSRRRRAADRRGRREREVAVPEATAALDPAALAARVEERQKVAAAVLELDEPFRTVVLLRYFEDESTRAIAARLDVAEATVRTRLHRAHEKLRARFERTGGADWRRRLLLLCVPLPGTPAPPAAVPAGPSVSAVGARGVAIVVLSGLLMWGLYTVLWPGGEDVPAALGGAGRASVPTDSTALAPRAPERRDVATPAATTAAGAPEIAVRRIAGRILDIRGRGIAGASIEADGRPLGVADARGRFAFPCPDQGSLTAGPGWVTIRSWILGFVPADDALIVAAPRVRITGQVVDGAGAPVSGVDVEARIHDVVGFPEPVPGTILVGHESGGERKVTATTDARGAFTLTGVWGNPFGELAVDVPGYRRWAEPLPETDRDGVRVVLRRGARPVRVRSAAAPPMQLAFAGRVRDARLAPIAGATVWVPWVRGPYVEPLTTDAAGRFALVTSRAELPDVLVAAPSRDPVRLTPAEYVVGDDGQVDLDIVLRRAARALTGRVLGPGDVPRPGLVVQLADPTMLGHVTRIAECLDGHEFGPHAVTGTGGAFRIAGLLDRAYRLRVIDPADGYAETFGPFDPNGPHVVLRVPAPRHCARAVRVVDRDGSPVPGVTVSCQVVQWEVKFGDGKYGEGDEGASTTFLTDEVDAESDADGYARFDDLPAGELRVHLLKPGWRPTETNLAPRAHDLVVRLTRLVLVRVDAPDVEVPDASLELFDRAGAPLDVWSAWGGGWADWFDDDPTVFRGRSIVLGVSEAVFRARLWDPNGGRVVREMTVIPAREGVTVLDFAR